MKIGFLMQEGAPDVRVRPLPGPANHVCQVFWGLQERGHHVVMLARFDNQIWHSNDLQTFDPVHVPGIDDGPRRRFESIVRGLQSRLGLPYMNRFESLRFAAACRQHFANYDFLYERMGWMGYGGGLAARWLRIPLILEANNGDFITELERLSVAPTGFQRWLAIALMRRAARRASHVVASGHGHRRRFIDWWRVPAEAVSVVENGTEVVDLLSREDLLTFDPPDGHKDEITIIFVGAFEPWHGIEVLLNALAKIVVAKPAVRLILIGDGTQKSQILRQIRDLHLEANVHLTGRLNIHEVSQQLQHADIAVAPYCGWMEFSGLKLFDYKAAGLAIVASGTDTQPPTLQHGKTAWIVPPCEPEPLAEAILHLSNNPALRRSLGRAARLEAEECHSWRHTVMALEDIFARVVNQ